MKLFDLSQFEKVAEDKHKTTMRHKDGHEIHIAHSSLPKIKQEQLRRLTLAKGGQVSKDALGSGEGGVSEQGRAVRKAHKTKDPKDMNYAKEEARGRADYERVASNPNIKGFDAGGDVSGNAADDTSRDGGDGGKSDVSSSPAAQAPVVVNVQAPNPYANQPGMQVPVQPTQNQTQAPTAQMNPSPAAPNVETGQGQAPLNPDGTMNPGATAQLSQQAIREQQGVDTAKSKGQLANENEYLNAAKAAAQKDQDNVNEIRNHTDAYAQYIANNPINENHLFENGSVGKKISTAFGLLAGGLKSGMVGGNNPAMDYLNQQIDRDIAAQKSRADQQKNVWGAYHQLYGDSAATNAAAKASMIDFYTHKGYQLAAQLGTPQAKAAADALAANMAVDKSKAIQDAAVDLRNLPGAGRMSQMMTPVSGGSSPSSSEKNNPTLNQNNSGGGASGGQGWLDKKLDSNAGRGEEIPHLGGKSENNSFLDPNASETVKQLKRYDTYAKKEPDKLDSAVANQTRTDQLLNQVDGIYDRLYARRNGVVGAIHRNFNPSIGGAVGGGDLISGAAKIGAEALHKLSNTATNQQYDKDLELLKGVVSGSIPRGDNFVNEAMSKFAPSMNDSPEQAIQKREGFKEFVRDHANEPLLKQYPQLLLKKKR